MTGDDALAAAIKADYRHAALDPATRALLDFAARMTLEPTGPTRDDLDRLRGFGFDDRAILDATHIVGFFNHVNRVVDALGIDLEDFMPAHPGRKRGAKRSGEEPRRTPPPS